MEKVIDKYAYNLYVKSIIGKHSLLTGFEMTEYEVVTYEEFIHFKNHLFLFSDFFNEAKIYLRQEKLLTLKKIINGNKS